MELLDAKVLQDAGAVQVQGLDLPHLRKRDVGREDVPPAAGVGVNPNVNQVTAFALAGSRAVVALQEVVDPDELEPPDLMPVGAHDDLTAHKALLPIPAADRRPVVE